MMATDSLPQALSIMGVPVVPFESYAHALACIEARIAARRKTFCVAINPEKVYRAVRSGRLLSVLRQANIGICDGTGVALAVRLLYGRTITRCTGVDLFLELLAASPKKGWKVFLLGASEDANARACDQLTRRHPGLRIAGRHHGYFDASEPVIERINASGADLLFVALGSPRQEFWITQNRAAIEVPFCMGVGGTLDVAAGSVKRAPGLCRRTGTEFLYRLIRQPGRIRRQWTLPLFAFGVLRQALQRR